MEQVSLGFLEMVDNDIQSINYILTNETPDDASVKALHMELDGRYQACIRNWDKSMYGFNEHYGVMYDLLSTKSIIHNLNMMKAKLETYRFQVNAVPTIMPTSTNIRVDIDNQININITFDQVREHVRDMSFLNEEQTKEVISKINNLEDILNSKEPKKLKWEKVRPILVWLADKSVDIGTALLPLLLKLQ